MCPPRPPYRRPYTLRPDPVLVAREACKAEVEHTIRAIEIRLESMPTAVETLALNCYELGQKSALVIEQHSHADQARQSAFEDRPTPLVEMDFESTKTDPGTPRALKESKKFKAPR
jgi:hypothetical protein